MEQYSNHIEFKKVSRFSEIADLEKLANIIFYEAYNKILKEEEIAFLLNTFQNKSIIDYQIRKENYQYYLIYCNNYKVGYFGFQINKNRLILSKLYVLKSHRKKNIGKESINFISIKAMQEGVDLIELLVNEGNINAISFYENFGFKVLKRTINSFDNKIFFKDCLMGKKV
ncbi:GNAT family N-acetyltransferase [Hanstruepera marina]|uniref:GNAT family N-acetyltransferase n=1 Tax=Hanstruepera marina TaxID=2873265 RepID=UPI001CA67E45|nr:GNAT family N-acetyltransferase [Hanstruepera marina]